MTGRTVQHPRHGIGQVLAAGQPTTIVRFDHGIEEVESDTLTSRQDAVTALSTGRLAAPIDAVTRAMALAIASCNDQWGVYSRSRIQLLPHQLWVCRQVLEGWPFRWLIADDVGLGKTIEAGLVMMPLAAPGGRGQRILVLAPAKLVPQWRQRLKDMFDLRFAEYAVAADPKGSFWDTAARVVGSIHTLRTEDRRKGLLNADPWDLVIVDEAHHMSIDDRGTATLSYDLLQQMEERRLIRSLLFFTGTPHRGKDAAFFGLMQLVRPDLFDPKRSPQEQYPLLAQAMIRNNKATVTDLKGEKLFTAINVHRHEFAYSAAEDAFYRTMSAFIIDGRAYADTLDARGASARILLLITLQKLAASSVAAIRSALRRRRAMLDRLIAAGGAAPDDLESAETLDDRAEAEEALPGQSFVEVMRGEVERLDELLTLADRVEKEGEETKVTRMLDLIDRELPAGEQVLLFTEYKATQRMVLEALDRRFGHGSAIFINGDERLDDVLGTNGFRRTVSLPREEAARSFNAGERRFLVSTEAAGEGIDLQERCATLVHVDLPWNPMRMHQRVGRLSRYGQTRNVQVHILRNPDTVEARIWDRIDEKLNRIQAAYAPVMAEGEDVRQLVIGIMGARFFDDIHAGAPAQGGGLDSWFDAATAQMDGRSLLSTVQSLFGNVRRFDFASASEELPKSDLPDLEPFFRLALRRHGRRLQRMGEGNNAFETLAPEAWEREDYAIRKRYEHLTFDRNQRGADATARVLGVGHALMDRALGECSALDAAAAFVPGLKAPLSILAVTDRVTDTGAAVRQIVVGVEWRGDDLTLLRDWEMLRRLNDTARPDTSNDPQGVRLPSGDWIDRTVAFVRSQLAELAPGMRQPEVHLRLMLLKAGGPEPQPSA